MKGISRKNNGMDSVEMPCRYQYVNKKSISE